MTKNIYIEAGVYKLISFSRFYEDHKEKDWEFHLFECNPLIEKHIRKKIEGFKDNRIHFYSRGLWNSVCKKELYLGGDRGRTYGSSFYEEKYNAYKNKTVMVDCINFNRWIISNFNKEDNIYLKLNVEGAEYEILKSMIKGGSIYYIKTLEIEFHVRKIKGEMGKKLKEEHEKIMFFLKNNKEINVKRN